MVKSGSAPGSILLPYTCCRNSLKAPESTSSTVTSLAVEEPGPKNISSKAGSEVARMPLWAGTRTPSCPTRKTTSGARREEGSRKCDRSGLDILAGVFRLSVNESLREHFIFTLCRRA